MNLMTGVSAVGLVIGGYLVATSNNNVSHVSVVDKTIINSVPVINKTDSTKQITALNLKADNVVKIEGEISENALDIAKEITKKSQDGKPVYISINSPGGSVLDGAQIISAMESAKGPVYTICQELCASMAAMIFSYGKERYMVDRSILMFHPASGGVRGTLEEMGSLLGTLTRYVNKMNVYVATRAGLDLPKFQAMFVSQLWIDAEDSVERKFADKIVSVHLDKDEKTVSIFSIPSSGDKNVDHKFNVIWK